MARSMCAFSARAFHVGDTVTKVRDPSATPNAHHFQPCFLYRRYRTNFPSLHLSGSHRAVGLGVPIEARGWKHQRLMPGLIEFDLDRSLVRILQIALERFSISNEYNVGRIV